MKNGFRQGRASLVRGLPMAAPTFLSHCSFFTLIIYPNRLLCVIRCPPHSLLTLGKADLRVSAMRKSANCSGNRSRYSNDSICAKIISIKVGVFLQI